MSEKWQSDAWLNVARGQLGVAQDRGRFAKPNPRVLEYKAAIGEPDREGWCIAFAAWVLGQCGIAHPADLNFAAWGAECTLGLGAIGVVEKLDHPFHHVGFVIGWTTEYSKDDDGKDRQRTVTVTLLGGNHKGRVTEREFSFDRFVAFRYPEGAL